MGENSTHNYKALLTKYLLGETTKEEQAKAEHLIRTDEEAGEFYKKIKRLHYAIEYKEAKKHIRPDKEFSHFKEKIKSSKAPPTSSPKIKRLFIHAGRFAAAFLLGMGVWYVLQFIHKPDMKTVQNGQQQVVSDTLADGTIACLNKNAALTYPKQFQKNTRDVSMKGEVFFNVVDKPEKPFIIKIDDFRAKVVGTAFNINASDQDTIKITVQSGKVLIYSIRKKQDQVLLTEGDIGIYCRSDQSISKFKNSDLNYLSWKTGILVFQNDNMKHVVKTLEEHYEIQIQVDNENINQCSLTSTFNNDSIEFVMEMIGITFGLDISQKDSVYIIHGDGC
jgi:ferric-dicitrate binding protein FerR (iron transport regulator)